MQNEESMRELIADSLDNIKKIIDGDTIVGQQIVTPSGVVVVPISRLNIGIATGGLDFPLTGIKDGKKNFGGAGGTGISLQPICFLVIHPDGETEILPMNTPTENTLDRVSDAITHAPDFVGKFMSVLSGEPISDNPIDEEAERVANEEAVAYHKGKRVSKEKVTEKTNGYRNLKARRDPDVVVTKKGEMSDH